MSEWWTYRPSEFLMFSARTWGRLLEAWNRALWPWQWLLLAAALVMLAAAWREPARLRAWIVLALAAAWTWVGWSFHWERFAEINTGARWFALAFGFEAALLAALAFTKRGVPMSRPWQAAGLAIAAVAAFAYPLIAPLTGRGWAQAEVALAMPDPTALFTVGLLLALPQRHRGWLLVIPALSLAVGWGTAWLLWAA